ncbi:MAG: hypothetical protein LUC37_03780 [Prevotella sp.]|nr:hypothetical protein [Prevotella sp.]
MAREIKDTPILYGEDAKKFELRMKRKRTEKPKARERRLRDYEDCMAMLEQGKNVRMATRKV